MSSLTDVSVIDDLSKQNETPPKNNWYNVVYLCVEKPKTGFTIGGFNCYKYTEMKQAEEEIYEFDLRRRRAIIPVCKWIPRIFHRFYLNYALKQIYWQNNISIIDCNKYSK
jgi:hypothetical protein